VVITNLWGSLKYKVVKTIVIDPTDIDAVKIIADADMLTLITCHPYTKNYQRYVVYCSRDAEELLSDQEIPYEGETYTSSENEIRLENQVNRYIMIVAVLLVLLVLFIRVGSDPPPENRENS
jgi:sortase A